MPDPVQGSASAGHTPANRTLADHLERRRRAALAGHHGETDVARALLTDPDPGVRATALGALVRCDDLTSGELRAALADEAPTVRRRAAEEAARTLPDDTEVTEAVRAQLDDPEPIVVETAAFALGERLPASSATVAALCEVATGHADALCREAAVAALGSVGDPAGLPAILVATGDKATVRRRAVIALAPFDGPEVEGALQAALEDRDWQVRQAAEDLLA